MLRSEDEKLLTTCFQELTGTIPTAITPLRPHASERRRYRLTSRQSSIIGVLNASRSENDAFVSLAQHFRNDGLRVPTIFLYKPILGVYLEEDLGDTTLLSFLEEERERTAQDFPVSAMAAYQKTIAQLPLFQMQSAKTLNFDLCYPRGTSYEQALSRDFALFKGDLVSRLRPSYDTTSLDGEFAQLVAFLSKAESDFFMYGDFQARNVMLCNGVPYFIDFQGGRRGPLQYDVASILYQISARIPETSRQSLVEYYLTCMSSLTSLSRDRFYHFYPAFIVTRMLQVLGVYGSQGLGAGKAYFSSSIPGALTTLTAQLEDPNFPVNLSKLLACVHSLRNAVPHQYADRSKDL